MSFADTLVIVKYNKTLKALPFPLYESIQLLMRALCVFTENYICHWTLILSSICIVSKQQLLLKTDNKQVLMFYHLKTRGRVQGFFQGGREAFAPLGFALLSLGN